MVTIVKQLGINDSGIAIYPKFNTKINYNGETLIGTYKIKSLTYYDYLIVWSDDPKVKNITIESDDYPEIFINENRYVIAAKKRNNYNLYKFTTKIAYIETSGTTPHCTNYGKDDTTYTLKNHPKINNNGSGIFAFDLISDPVIAIVGIANYIRNYYTASFEIKNNKFYANLVSNMNDDGAIPILIGPTYNNYITGLFNPDFDIESLFTGLSLGDDCSSTTVTQILSNDQNHKPTLFINDHNLEIDVTTSDAIVNNDKTKCPAHTLETGEEFLDQNVGTYQTKVFYNEDNKKRWVATRYCNVSGNASNPTPNYKPYCATDDIWEETSTGGKLVKDCPSGYTGSRSRICKSDGSWDVIDESACKKEKEKTNIWLWIIWIVVIVIIIMIIIIIVVVIRKHKRNNESEIN